jgi:hypothetical protein
VDLGSIMSLIIQDTLFATVESKAWVGRGAEVIFL